MSNENKTPQTEVETDLASDAEATAKPAAVATADAEQTEAEQADANTESLATEQTDPAAALAAITAQADEFKDRYLRAEAELENVRKRSEREVQKARKFALEKFAGDLLAVMDSLDMGLQAAKAEGATIEAVAEGTELTFKMFIDTLTKHGVEQIDPTGEKFDPEEHEAMVMQPSAEAEPNTVIDTFQKGYKLNDRVLRAARVVVAKAAE